MSMNSKDVVSAVFVLDMIWMMFDRARSHGVKITPDNIRDHIAKQEAQADANDKLLGIEPDP